MSTRKRRKPLTTTEQALRWTGLGAVLLAIALAVAQIPGTEGLPLLLLVGAAGCLVALGVVSFQQGRAGG